MAQNQALGVIPEEDFDFGKEILRAIRNCDNNASPNDIYNCLYDHTSNPPVPIAILTSQLTELCKDKMLIVKEVVIEGGSKIIYSLTEKGRQYLG